MFFNKFPCGLHFFALYISVNPNNENSTWIWNLFSPKTRKKIFPWKYLNSVNFARKFFATYYNIPLKDSFLPQEAMINSLTAAYLGVPVRLLTGDKGLCDWMKSIQPNVETVAVSEGWGRGSISIHPNKALRLIREAACRAMKKDAKDCLFPLPEHFVVDISFKEHIRARSEYPGLVQTGPCTVRYESDDWVEVLRMLNFVL